MKSTDRRLRRRTSASLRWALYLPKLPRVPAHEGSWLALLSWNVHIDAKKAEPVGSPDIFHSRLVSGLSDCTSNGIRPRRQRISPGTEYLLPKQRQSFAISYPRLARTPITRSTKNGSSRSAPRQAVEFWLSLIPTAEIQSGSSAPESSMKKPSRKMVDGLRAAYTRSDFGPLVRGKYAKRVTEATNFVVLDPQVAKAFPNDRAVNQALRGLLRKRKSPTARSRRARRVPRAD